jgi:hypothetical protein
MHKCHYLSLATNHPLHVIGNRQIEHQAKDLYSAMIIKKILTTRLQQQINKLIDLDQTSFLKGRSDLREFCVCY